MDIKPVKVGSFSIGDECSLVVITGPCVIESESHAIACAEQLVKIFATRKNINFVFKSSYDKANRTSVSSFRGPGLEVGLKILEKIKNTFGIPVFTDVHSPEEAFEAAHVCDVIQIPAFLCRQTDLLLAAGKTKATVNIKKGQFLSPWDMKHAIDKIRSTGNEQIILTERGTTFGYNNLVSDMRSIPIMRASGFPVLYDATHSVQLPSGLGDRSGGEREFIPILARAALAAGCDGIYAESHPDPDAALSDASCVISLQQLPFLLDDWEKIFEISRLNLIDYS